MKNILFNDRAIAPIILSNLFILFLAIELQWDIFTLIILYWLETAIIGFFTISKLIHLAKWRAVGLIIFFCLHFGIFMSVHLIFILGMFGEHETLSAETFAEVPNTIKLVLFPAISLFASHLYSFTVNYIGKKEYKKHSPLYFFVYPYPRVIVMHLTILFGAFLSFAFSSVVWSLILLTTLKTLVDVKSHQFMHKNKERPVDRPFRDMHFVNLS